jgi:hypothetical protein
MIRSAELGQSPEFSKTVAQIKNEAEERKHRMNSSRESIGDDFFFEEQIP